MSNSPKQLLVNTINQAGNLLLSPPVGGFGYFHNHGPRDKRRVAITFDDGPSKPCTTALLDSLDNLGVKATFFWVGVNAAWHPDLVERAYAAGHDIGNHSWEHSRKAGLSFQDTDHIERAARQISQVIGVQPRLYRPPWGWMAPWEGRRLTKHGYNVIGWDVYTLDWHWPEEDGKLIADKARQDTKPGSILLFHDANAGVKIWDKKETVRAIEHIVPALRADGYEIVPVSELLGVPAYSPLSERTALTA